MKYFTHTIDPAPLRDYYLFLAYFGIFNLIVDGGFEGAAVKRISEGTDYSITYGCSNYRCFFRICLCRTRRWVSYGLTVGGLLNFRYMDLKLVWFKMNHVKNLLGFSLWIFLFSSGYAIKKIYRHHHYQLVHDRY